MPVVFIFKIREKTEPPKISKTRVKILAHLNIRHAADSSAVYEENCNDRL